MRNIAIVGGGVSWIGRVKRLSFLDDTEMWTVARLASSFPTARRAYEVHSPDVYGHYIRDIREAIDCGVDVWMRYPVPGARQIPVEDIRAMTGGFISSSLSLMIGHAVLEGDVGEIGIFGFFMVDKDYVRQRPSAWYYMGFAAGRGIRINEQSNLIDWGADYGSE